MSKIFWFKPIAFILATAMLPSLSFGAHPTAEKCGYLFYDSTAPSIIYVHPEAVAAFYLLPRESQYEIYESERARSPRPTISKRVRSVLENQAQKKDAETRALNARWALKPPQEISHAGSHSQAARYMMSLLKNAPKQNLLARLGGAHEVADPTILLRHLEVPVLRVMLTEYLNDFGDVLKGKKFDFGNLGRATEWKDEKFFFQVAQEVLKRSLSKDSQVLSDLELLVEQLYGLHHADLVASTTNKMLSSEQIYVESSVSQKLIQLFASAYSPLTLPMVRAHLGELSRYVSASEVIGEGQVIFTRSGLDLDNAEVIDGLNRLGYSAFVDKPSRRVATTIRVAGELIWAKSLQEYYDQKIAILDKKSAQSLRRGDSKEAERLKDDLLTARLTRAGLVQKGLIPKQEQHASGGF